MSIYKVEKGDSLWRISQRFAEEQGLSTSASNINALIAQIKENNQLNGDTIYPEQELKLPTLEKEKEREPKPKTEPDPSSTSSSSSAPPQETKASYALDRYEASAIQQLLVDSGYNLGSFGPNKDGVDNDWGKVSLAAAKKWQAQNGFTADGNLTIEQFDQLKEQVQSLRRQEAPERSRQGSMRGGKNYREEVLANVKQYVGFRESIGDNKGQLVRQFLRSDEYASAQRGAAAPEGSAWCAGMVSYILAQELPGAVDYTVLAKSIMKESMQTGAYHKIGDYTPQPGDLVFFERGETGDWKGHVGFVEKVDPDGTIHTIEGNKAHPDFRRIEDYVYDPERPDGVRRVSYKPEDFVEDRVLGFANLSVLAQSSTKTFETEVAAAPEKAPQTDPSSEGPILPGLKT